MGLPIHPKATESPMMSEEQLRSLADSILRNGQQYPILTIDGMIRDGRNREAACEIAGVPPIYKAIDGHPNPDDLVDSLELDRRHQGKGALAVRAARRAEAMASRRQKEATVSAGTEDKNGTPVPAGTASQGRSREQAAREHGVGKTTVSRALDVVRHGTESLVSAVEDGTLTVREGERLAKETPEKQDAAVAEAKQGKKPGRKKKDRAEVVAEKVERDAWGIPIMPHAEAAFATAGAFKPLLATLREAQRLLDDLVNTPAGAHMVKHVQFKRNGKVKTLEDGTEAPDGRFWLHHLENAIAVIEGARPAVTDCPYAHNNEQPHPERCGLCHDTRWLDQVGAKEKSTPTALVNALREHYARPVPSVMDGEG